MDKNIHIAGANNEDAVLVRDEVKALANLIKRHIESRPQAHEHFVTILGYTVELLLASLDPFDDYDMLSRTFAGFLGIVHKDVCRMRNQANERYS